MAGQNELPELSVGMHSQPYAISLLSDGKGLSEPISYPATPFTLEYSLSIKMSTITVAYNHTNHWAEQRAGQQKCPTQHSTP